MLELNRVYNMDCREGISLLDDNSIDLVITSPPYNVDLGNNKYNKNAYDLYNDNQDHKAYIQWLNEIFKAVYPKLKIGGRCCINIGDGKNGAVPTHSDIIHFMTEDIKFIPLAQIIWDKKQIGNRTAWGSFNSPSCPSFPTPFEYILVFAKETKKLQHKGVSDLTKDEFIKWAYGIWEFAPENKMKKMGHPAMFPVTLPLRLMKMFSYPGDTVVDLFGGLGTTGVAAKQTNRNYILFELSKEYAEKAQERIDLSELPQA